MVSLNSYGSSLNSNGTPNAAGALFSTSNELKAVLDSGTSRVRWQIPWYSIERAVQTTSSSAISSGTQTISVATWLPIFVVGASITVDTGSPQETITLTAVNQSALTITATFAKAHSGSYPVAATPQAGDVPGNCGSPARVAAYDWSVLDDYVAACGTNGLYCDFVLQNAPTWHTTTLAIDSNKSVPVASDAAAFATQVMQRVKSKNGTINSFEVANEGFNSNNLTASNASQMFTQMYALLSSVRQSVKAVNSSTSIGAPADLNSNTSNISAWTTGFFAANCHTLVEYVNMHFYPPAAPDSPNTGQSGLVQWIGQWTSAMQTAGVSLPIQITEFGWTILNNAGTNGGIADSTYNSYLSALLQDVIGSNAVSAIYQYNLDSIVPGTNFTSGTHQSYLTWKSSIQSTPVFTVSTSTGSTTSNLLPGQRLINGVSNFLAGTNMPPDYSNTNVRNNSTIQGLIKSAGYTLMRCAIPAGSSNSYIDETAQACAACGCAMLVILTHNNLTWNKSMVAYLGSRCNLYEFGNEPDLYGGYTGANYLNDWNANIPSLRQINPNAAFGGPVMGVYDNLAGWLNTWLPGCKTSGVLPDFISYHIYPCTGQSSETACIASAPNIGHSTIAVNSQVKSILGYTLPLGMTEWNHDAAAAQSYITNQSFVNAFIPPAFDGLVNGGFAMACQFDAGSNAGGGVLDLISTNTLQPQIEYAPMSTAIAKYNLGGTGSGNSGGSGNLSITPGNITLTCQVGSNPNNVSVTLTNTGSASISVSAQTDFNYLTVSPASSTIAAGSSTTSSIGATASALSAGTYTGQIAYSYSVGNTLTVDYLNVTLIISASGSGGGTTALTLYTAQAASTTLPSADVLYTVAGSPSTAYNTTQLGTATGYGEVIPRGTPGGTPVWQSLNSIGNPTGNGLLYDSTALEGQSLLAGNWSAAVRLNCALYNNPNSGQIVADIVVRAFKYNTSTQTYTPIVTMTLTAQTIPAAYTNFTLPATATTSNTSFSTGDKLYVDIWLNVTQNNNGASGQLIRMNRLSTDTTGMTGDPLSSITTPGITTSTSSGSGTLSLTPSALAFQGGVGGASPAAQTTTLTNTGSASGTWNATVTYGSGNNWLSETPTSGTLAAGANASITVTANLSGLAVGTYTATVTYTLGSSTAILTVTLSVTANTFITRTNATLYNGGTAFRASGANVYWLGMAHYNANGTVNVHYPSTTEIDDALYTAQRMGATVIRSLTLGVSVGNSNSVWPALNAPNAQAFAPMDYALYRAAQLGLRVIVPLCDGNTAGYAGSIATFTNWRNISDATQFFVNSQVIADFQAYVAQLLNHVNTYSGVSYLNDPTILAWETGNELNNPPTSWTTTIANYLKQLDSNHLVMDGTYGVNSAALSLANVDIYTNHFYPINTSQLTSDATATSGANKAYIVGAYDWTGGALSTQCSTIESNAAISGDCFYSLLPHDDTYGYVNDPSTYSLYYPGTTTAMQTASATLRTHLYTMRGVSPAPAHASVNAPTLTNLLVQQSGGVLVEWHGVPGGASYDLESGTSSNGPFTQIATLTDSQAPYTDTGGTSGTWYRIRAFNLGNVAGAYSAVSSATSSSSGSTTSSNITITNAGVNLLRDALAGNNNAAITYVALGTSSTAPTTTDTTLGNETFRKAVSSYVDGQSGEIIITCYLAAGDAVGQNIQEIGFFGGNAATTTPNTGVLLAHGLYQHNNKSAVESIQLQLDVSFLTS